MDVALLHMTQRATPTFKQSSTQTVANESSFDKMFNEAVQTSAVQSGTSKATEMSEVENAQVVEEVTEVLQSDSLEETLNTLNIQHDEALLFVEIAGELTPIDEAMNIEDLAAMLNMSPQDLQQIIAKLTNGEGDTTDVWQMLEQAPQLLAQIASVLQGDNQLVTPKEAGQLAKFIQLAQLVGQKSDTMYQQDMTLADTKTALQQLTAHLTLSEQQPKQNFGQTLQQSTYTTESPQSTEQIQAPTQPQSSQQGVRTVSIVLPMERSQQSEALMKELQNQLNRAQLANNNGTMKLMLRLFPENLGQIRIEVMQQDGVMQARILATTAAGKELLDSNLNQLKSTLVAQNIQMDRIDIAQSLQSSDSSRDQGLFNQFFRQQQSDVEDEQQETDEEEVSFEEILEQQLQPEEV